MFAWPLSPELYRFLLRAFPVLWLAILFIQSGLDKVTDRSGNLSWMEKHFAQSPLRSGLPLLLTVLTALELATGVISAGGVLQLVLAHQDTWARAGAVLALLSLTALFFGQRVAKAYDGAAALVPYFLLALAALYLLGPA